MSDQQTTNQEIDEAVYSVDDHAPKTTPIDLQACPEKLFVKFIGGEGCGGLWADKPEPGYEVEYVRSDLCQMKQ